MLIKPRDSRNREHYYLIDQARCQIIMRMVTDTYNTVVFLCVCTVHF